MLHSREKKKLIKTYVTAAMITISTKPNSCCLYQIHTATLKLQKEVHIRRDAPKSSSATGTLFFCIAIPKGAKKHQKLIISACVTRCSTQPTGKFTWTPTQSSS